MLKLLGRLTALLVLGAAIAVGWIFYPEIEHFFRQRLATKPEDAPAPDLDQYLLLISELDAHRQRLLLDYEQATTDQERESVLLSARALLEGALPTLMKCWLGTPWDFNGTAHQPGPDKVACGYFVSSLLQDAGFQIEWAPLAQQPSQNILATFLPEEEMHIRVDTDYERFVDEVLSFGPGIHIVGLDSHVAFLVAQSNGTIRFIHSSGSSPWCVVDENRTTAHTLQRSRYRVFGNLTANQNVLAAWLTQQPFPTKKN
ncbi:MAG: hypothetical protein O3A92_06780 [Verrucomicrobia bacterium]|nr:hypothetical protein [Verrucomicrobiota bacterium]